MNEDFYRRFRDLEQTFEGDHHVWRRLAASSERVLLLLVLVLVVSLTGLGVAAFTVYRLTAGPGNVTVAVANLNQSIGTLQQDIGQATTTIGRMQEEIGVVQQSIGGLSARPPTVTVTSPAIVSGTAVYLGEQLIYQTDEVSIDGSPALVDVSYAPSGQVFLILTTTSFELETLTQASLRTLDGNEMSTVHPSGLMWAHSWAPRDDLLAVATWDGGYLDVEPNLEVWNPQTGRVRRLAAEVRAGPLWSPDGRWLAFLELIPRASDMQIGSAAGVSWRVNLATPDLSTVIMLDDVVPGCSQVTADPRCELAWHQVDSQTISLCVWNPLTSSGQERCYRVTTDPLVPPEEIGKVLVKGE